MWIPLAYIIMLGSKKGVFFASNTHSNLFQITAFKVRNHGVASKMHFQLLLFFLRTTKPMLDSSSFIMDEFKKGVSTLKS